MYSLAHYFEEAKIKPIPDWFKEIQIIHPVFGYEIKPRWHQITGLNFCVGDMRTGLYDEQGTGKTLVATAFAVWNAAVGNKCVCVMPPILRKQFKEAVLNGFPGVDKYISVEIYSGSPAQRDRMYSKWDTTDQWPGIVIMSYDIFRQEGWRLFNHYATFIGDEAKFAANPDSKISVSVDKFMGKANDKYGVIMNGTPARTDLTDLYGYIQWTAPGTYVSRLQFDLKHVDYKSIPVRLKGDRIREIRVVNGFHNIYEIYENLYKRGRRVEKSDVKEMPPKNIIPYTFDLSHKHHSAYKRFVEEKLLVFTDNTVLDGTTSQQLRMNAIRSVFDPSMLGVDEKSAIFDAVDEIIEDTDVTKTKVVIMAYHRATVEAFAEHLKQYNPAVIYGATTVENYRQKEKFVHDATCRVAVINYLSGGVGIDGFQNVCHTAISVEPTTPGDFDQACDRLHREGQGNPVNIYLLMPKGTVMVDHVNVMLKRKQVNRTVVSALQMAKELLGEEEEVLVKKAA